jgi:fused signal recognition particle receptor
MAEALDQKRSGRRRRRGRAGNRREEGENPTQEFTSDSSQEVPPAERQISPEPQFSPEPLASQSAVPAPIAVSVPASIAERPPVQPMPAPVISAPAPVVSAPVVPSPAPIVVTPPVSAEALKATLDQVGLQWVQTDPTKAPTQAIAEPPAKLGRTPRRNTETAPQEPLVMVETRQNNS